MKKVIFGQKPNEHRNYFSWCIFHVDGKEVFYEANDFDREDQRGYLYFGKFSLKDYRAAIEQLKKTGNASLTGEGGSLTMSNQGKLVRMVFSSGGSVGSTPGGASVSGSINHHRPLQELAV